MANTKINKTEQKIFFNHIKQLFLSPLKSPFIYFVSIIFSISAAVIFYIRDQFFTTTGSTDFILFFSVIPYLCTILIPALCYKNSILSYEDFVPLSKIQKIVANFLNILLLYILIIFFSLLNLIPVSFFGDFEAGKFFTGFFCLILFGAAMISICIFMNELISSKIAALILSIFLLLIINCSHLFAVYVPMNNFFTEIFKKLSIAWHFDAAGKGIIDTRDFVWLSGIMLLFITLTLLLKENKAENHSRKFKITITGFIILFILIMANGNRYYKRFDLSQNKTYSLSKYSKTLLKKIETPTKITYYRSSSLNRLYPQIRDVSDFLISYSEQNKNISLLIKDPDRDSSAADLLEQYGITSQQMRTVKNNSTEYVNVYSAIILEQNGNYQTIPFSLSADSLEYDLDVRLKNLISSKSRVVNIILGNGMNFTEDYGYVIPWLTSQGFICNPIFINDPDFVNTLNRSEGLLYVIGDSEIDIEKAIAIENYILNNKGNALFNITPYSVDIEGDWSISKNQRTNLVEMLENWGILFADKIAADISCSTITMYSQDESENPFQQNSTHAKVLNYPLWINTLPQQNCRSGATFFWPDPLEITATNDDFTVEPYIISSPSSYFYEFERNAKFKLIETNPFILEQQNISSFDKGNQILSAKISGNLTGLYNLLTSNHSEIMVIPDQYFLNNTMTGYNSKDSGDYRNFELVTGLLLKLNGEEDLSVLQSKFSTDTSLYKISDVNKFVKLQLFTYLFIFILIPLLISAVYVILQIILKHKNKIIISKKETTNA